MCPMTPVDQSPFEMPHELAACVSDQIEVTLLWWERENRAAVSVIDRKANQTLLVDVDGRDSLDVFRHPYAYAPEAAGIAA
jgi:hypothetical protein